MENVAALVRSIFQKESLEDCSLEELQAMAGQYSYFTPVQFLLAEKLRTTDQNLFKEQVQKLSLHFNNPLWLDYLLNPDKTEELPIPVISATVKEDVIDLIKGNRVSETNVIPEERGITESVIDEVVTNSSETFEPIQEEMFGSNEKNAETMEFVEQNSEGAEVETPAPLAEENNGHQIPIPPLPDLNQEPAATDLTFQPYHTVDYFASQGIKFVAEEKPTDRFGKQL